MAWIVSHGGTTERVEVEAVEGGYRLRVDGEEVVVRASFPQAGVLRMLLDGRSRSIDVRATKDGQEVVLRGVRYDVDVVDERDLALRALAAGPGGAGAGEVIATSMPGKVVALLVAEGQEVAAGQGVVVVEAMKMENELKAAHAGVVRAIHVAVGQALDAGAELVVLGPLPSP